MNEIFRETITMNAPIESVWNYFINLEENAAKWMNGIPSMEKQTSGDIKKGTKYVFEARGKKHATTISELKPMKSVTLTSIQGNFKADYTYSFSKQKELTQITLIATCEAKGVSKLLSPMIKMAIKQADSGQLENFKEVYK